jgi:hypothetical protein
MTKTKTMTELIEQYCERCGMIKKKVTYESGVVIKNVQSFKDVRCKHKWVVI